jgi:phosphatidylserine/phosphatidylglycerophosphate/cardiolipin synthase-like enzyme
MSPAGLQAMPLANHYAAGLAEDFKHTADLSDGFFAAMHTIAATLGTQAEFMLAVMNSESGIRASAHNPNGHASGLIQFMPATLRGLGWTQGHEAFRRLTADEQLPFVERYYLPHVRQGLNSTARLYQTTFLPATLGRGSEPDTVIVDIHHNDNVSAYAPNRGLDRRGDGRILVGDLTAFVERAKRSERWSEALARLQAASPGPVPPAPVPPHPVPPTPDPPSPVPPGPVPPMPVPPATPTHPLLRRGARGDAVREAQTKLNIVHGRNVATGRLGLQGAPLGVDGVFGPLTYSAIVSFQQQVFPSDPREWDGVLGPKTWQQLDLASVGTGLDVPPIPPSPGGGETVQADPRLPREQVMRWFTGGTDSQNQPMGRVTSNNRVVHLIRGRSAFDAMMRAMRTANAPGHFIYLLGWFMSDDFAVAGGTTLRQLFTGASQAGVAVRAMLWDQPLTQNTAEVDHINALPRGAAILDNRTLNLGSHHQKVLIVNGTEGLYAFCGGVDFNPDRIGNPDRKPGYPMHDVHSQIQGPAAFDLLQVFQQRWNDHPDHVNLDARKGAPPMVSSPAPIRGATDWVQISRTYGNGNAHRGIDSDNFGTRPRGYTFLRGRAGEQTVKHAILHAISQARRFIYLEDQYLVSLQIRDALIRALPSISHLTILIPDGTIADLPQGNFRRREFIAPLRAAGGSKVRVFHPHPPRDPFGYVHAKMWVFDDEFAIVGSANCNRRGYTHDGEVVAGICDEGNGEDLRFAHRLRVDLWALHLNVSTADVMDGVASAALWLRRVGTGRVEAHNENAGIERVHTDVSWNNAVDPDGS